MWLTRQPVASIVVDMTTTMDKAKEVGLAIGANKGIGKAVVPGLPEIGEHGQC